jgi:hypothetical protein
MWENSDPENGYDFLRGLFYRTVLTYRMLGIHCMGTYFESSSEYLLSRSATNLGHFHFNKSYGKFSCW